jgi:hypothetical protein
MCARAALFALIALLPSAGCDRGGASPDADADADRETDLDRSSGADADLDGDLAADSRPDAESSIDAEAEVETFDRDTTPDSDQGAEECIFNRDCPAAERCECDEATGCFCAPGARGSGLAGFDACDDGDDCASALCVEGTAGLFYCSGECRDESDCGPMLPLCMDIAFLGRVCVRTSPGG